MTDQGVPNLNQVQGSALTLALASAAMLAPASAFFSAPALRPVNPCVGLAHMLLPSAILSPIESSVRTRYL